MGIGSGAPIREVKGLGNGESTRDSEEYISSLIRDALLECLVTGIPPSAREAIDVKVASSKLGTDKSYVKRDATATLNCKVTFREINSGEQKVLEKLGDSCVQPIKIIHGDRIKIAIFPLLKGPNCLDAIADGTLDHALVKKKILQIHDKLFGRLWMDRKKGQPDLQELYIDRMRERINNIDGAKIRDGDNEYDLEGLLREKILVERGDEVFRLDEDIVTMLENASELMDSVKPPMKCCIHGDPYLENIILSGKPVSSDGTRREYIARLVDTTNATSKGTYDFDVVKILNTKIWYHLRMALRRPEEEKETIKKRLRFKITRIGKEKRFTVGYTFPDTPPVIDEICSDIEKKASIYAEIIGDEHLEKRKEIGLAMVQLCVAGKIAAEHPEIAAILICEGGIRLQRFLAATPEGQKSNHRIQRGEKMDDQKNNQG